VLEADSSKARTAARRGVAASLPAHMVRRPRLIEALKAPSGRLVIVTGPAGSGKTVAVRDWLSTTSGPTAWLSLEARHTDPERFLEDLVATVDALAPGLEDALGRDESADHEAGWTLARAFDHLATAPPATLVLDDLHVIDRSPTSELFAHLVDSLGSSNLTIVICSRSDPPLPLHRFRLSGDLVELRQADLRFDRAEAEQFFARFPAVRLSSDQVDRLAERTEGWAAGLQFAALSLVGREDADAFVDRFAGSDRHVADFLLDEVLDRQPADVRDFLLATSVLERLRSDLCAHVTGRSDAAAVLRRIEAEHLFLVPLDDEREWFRYHHLFGQLLRRELRVSHPEVESRSHDRAAAWFGAHGAPDLAIDHLLDAERYAEAFELLTEHLQDYQAAGRNETVRGWLGRFPAAFVDTTPGHQLTTFLAHARAGQIALGRQVIDRARAGGLDDAVGIHFDVTEAALSAILGDPERAIELGEATWARRDEVDLGVLPPDLVVPVRELWGYLPVALARAHALLDDRAGVRRWAGVLREQGPRLPGDVVGVLGAEAWAEARNGRLRVGAELAEQALALGTEQGRASRRTMIGARAALALVHRERDELDRAMDVLAPYVASALREGHVGITTLGEIELARVECAKGDAAAGIARVLRVRRDRAVDGTPRFLARVLDAAECRLRLHAGDVERAEDLLGELDPGPERTLLTARLALTCGHDAEAEPLLADLAGTAGNRRHLFEAAALRARAAAATGDLAAARRVLAVVAETAQREGAVRVFLDEGFDIADLLPAGPSARGVLATVTANTALVEALSERELSVLRYLPSRLSNREIGDELYVSLNTVKSHLKTIYRKLDVERRDEAVRRARQLGLL
jgi:LuxR family maltose regulon positive regulatory protein